MTAPAVLSPAVITAALTRLAGWAGDGSGLVRTWHFPSFRAAMDFLAATVPGIEARQHHPEWTAVYDRVGARLRTHDAGDRVTAADIDLAHHLDQIAREHAGR